jgi:hypothetical protein
MIFLDHSFETAWASNQWKKIAAQWEGDDSLTVCDSMAAADAILVTLVDPNGQYEEIVKELERSKKFSGLGNRLFVFDSSDDPLGLFRGIYCSLRSYLFRSTLHRTGCYMQSFNEFISRETDSSENRIDYLFSFQGNLTSGVRKSLFSHDFRRNDILIERTMPFWHDIGSPEFLEFKRRYAEVISRSKYVLCPRGIGTSSFRLYETMQSERVPVIISDAWVPWSNTDWRKFCLRVREKDVADIPDICLDAEPKWKEMAAAARKHWEDWFSHKGLARLIAVSISEIRSQRKPLLETFGLHRPVQHALAGGRGLMVRSVSHFAKFAHRLKHP